MELTEVAFWDEYWKARKLPDVFDPSFSFDRCLARNLKKSLRGCRGEVLEIGCAPGKWLAYLATELGLLPSGIEYSAVGVEATIKNFSLLQIKYGKIWHGDFIDITPEKKFDVVMSLGFIEHFDAAAEVVTQHVKWLKPGGVLVLGVPNFRGIYKPIQKILDPTLLEKHNLTIMNLTFFRKIADLNRLKIRYLNYLGSFEPSLPIPRAGARTIGMSVIRICLGAARYLRRLRFLDYINCALISSYLLAIYENTVQP